GAALAEPIDAQAASTANARRRGDFVMGAPRGNVRVVWRGLREAVVCLLMQTIDTRMIFPIELSYLLILVAVHNPSHAGARL
ncbi:hypothetical protein, partial [Niveibacterium sp.]|uniref:hypothetical protein n=1 Tax=Niveibacterium sp. TaxID=2017444 RepID=UPI0035B16569